MGNYTYYYWRCEYRWFSDPPAPGSDPITGWSDWMDAHGSETIGSWTHPITDPDHTYEIRVGESTVDVYIAEQKYFPASPATGSESVAGSIGVASWSDWSVYSGPYMEQYQANNAKPADIAGSVQYRVGDVLEAWNVGEGGTGPWFVLVRTFGGVASDSLSVTISGGSGGSGGSDHTHTLNIPTNTSSNTDTHIHTVTASENNAISVTGNTTSGGTHSHTFQFNYRDLLLAINNVNSINEKVKIATETTVKNRQMRIWRRTA
jgi:hypothetical protein